jgi:hypothetical protein
VLNFVLCRGKEGGKSKDFTNMLLQGLLFRKFGELNHRKIPFFGSIVTVVAATVLAFFFDLSVLGDMISCGTLVIFTLVPLFSPSFSSSPSPPPSLVFTWFLD